MDIDETILKNVIQGNPEGDFYPYNIGVLSLSAVDDYIKACVNGLKNNQNVEFEADYNHYGSGFSSYVDVFMWLKDGSSTKQKKDYLLIEGIHLYICRLYPVAVYGTGSVTRNIGNNGRSHGFLRPKGLETSPEGEQWRSMILNLQNRLNEYQYVIPFKEYLDSPLPFSADIETVLDEGHYKIFDAFFYWED
ncbi:hypothetical protein MNQ98_21010 [Paenibacillus sp. N3/727]|uniref:hypothetical protein n=1 Tax=Paenibacillus sp. N3/727 TaxID=2925845 RepID=UPI001F536BA7|nr:hypothetical protein [Paenibacillus sp. N3/727]UNK16955.1 hypothetical protein MNQ98_21010 [Paenibacillus sp. N3/727]